QDKKLNEYILIFDNFGINGEAFDIKDPDSDDYDTFDDSISSITVAESLTSEDAIINKSIEIQLFTWNELAFEQAQILANKKENNDDYEIEWEDLEYESSETASYITESTENEGLDYFIDSCEKKQTINSLSQLLGTWEIDSKAFESVKNDNKLYTLGVCGSNYAFDQNELHDANLKNIQSIKKSSCLQHSTSIIGRTVQAPCMGLKTCSAFKNYSNIDSNNNKYQPRYIYNQCFNLQGGHFFQRSGINKKPEPSLRLGHINIVKIIESDHDLTPKIAKKNGEMLGTAVWKSRHEIQQNKEALEKPSSLAEYQAAFPQCILNFFNGLITNLQKRKHDIANKKRRQRELEIKAFDEARVNKIAIFFVSVILSIAFPATDIWLTHVMSSLA
ncbi:5086_t:CDS:2, partial [Dentiscutata heterogama]